jgi:hypothetical protein
MELPGLAGACGSGRELVDASHSVSESEEALAGGWGHGTARAPTGTNGHQRAPTGVAGERARLEQSTYTFSREHRRCRQWRWILGRGLARARARARATSWPARRTWAQCGRRNACEEDIGSRHPVLLGTVPWVTQAKALTWASDWAAAQDTARAGVIWRLD